MRQPTSRTLQECRERGWIADVTERWVPAFRKDGEAEPATFMRGHRKDLMGFIDIFAVDADANQIVLIQATSGSGGNASARVKKILGEHPDKAAALLKAGARIEVWAWRKYRRPINRKYWRPRIARAVENSDGEIEFRDVEVVASTSLNTPS